MKHNLPPDVPTPENEPAVCQGPTLVDALLTQAAENGDATHLVLLGDDPETEPQPITFAQLADGARAVARALEARGVEPHDNVALMLPTSREFFYIFAGVLLSGAVPVPIYPPVKISELEEYVARHAGILRNAEVKVLVTFREAENLARLLTPRVPRLTTVVQAERLVVEGRRAAEGRLPAVTPQDLGLIQYTSGSTGDPKGVTLTHANLVANVRSIGAALGAHQNDVVVSWLPLYHDMGLIGCWLFAVCHGLPMISMPPLAFLRRPKRWLWAFHDYRGTLSPAPNFAYELCLRRARDRDLEGLDLSSWRVALNGAEPINPDTLLRFEKRFGAYGFRPETMLPVYGLAESSVAVTFPDAGERPRIDRLARDPFQKEGRAVPAADDDPAPLRFVGVGRPIPDTEIRLVDGEGREVGERREGHIEFRGLSTTPGYYKNPEATAEIKGPNGWTKSGDLGYLADGDLFITGRVKDMIIKGGRNIYPQEVEVLAAEIEGVRKGCVVAFGVPLPDGAEGYAVIAETRVTDDEARRQMRLEIRRRLTMSIGVAPDAVDLVRPQTLPKTPSGKLRRREARARFLDGRLTQRRGPGWLQVAKVAAGSVWHALRRRR